MSITSIKRSDVQLYPQDKSMNIEDICAPFRVSRLLYKTSAQPHAFH